MAYGAMCPQQFFSARSLSRIFQEDLKFFQINGMLAKEGQINHLQIQSVLYFSLYEKTGSSLTLCHPSTNAPNIIKLLTISCGDQSVLLTAFTPRLSLLHILGEDKKKTDTVLFSSTVLPI